MVPEKFIKQKKNVYPNPENSKKAITPQEFTKLTKGFIIFVILIFTLISFLFIIDNPSITGKAVDDVVSFGILEPVIEENKINLKLEEPIVEELIPEEIKPVEEVKEEIVEEDLKVEEPLNETEEEITFENQEMEFKTAIDQNDCGNIGVSGQYFLINDVTNAGTCFTFSADEILLDCNGSTVTFGTGGGDSVYGFTGSNVNHILIANCPSIISNLGGSYNNGIFFEGVTNLTIQNVTVITGGDQYDQGIDISESQDINITDNIIAQPSSAYVTGISITYTNDTNITNNQITADNTLYNKGISIYDSYNTSIYDNFIELNGTLQNDPAAFAYRGIELYGISQFENFEYTEIINNTIISYSPNGRTIGNDLGAGIYIYRSKNITMIENKINMTLSDPLIIKGTSMSNNDYNHSIDETNLVNGLKIGYNYSVSDMTLFENVDLTETYGTLICAKCISVVYDNVSINTAGIKLFDITDSIIRNSFINSSIGSSLLMIPETVFGVAGPCMMFNQYINNNYTKTSTADSSIYMDQDCQKFIFNNSYGQILWTFDFSSLVVSSSLAVGDGINLEQNRIGLEELSTYSNLNSSAEIEIRNLAYTSTPYLFKITNNTATTVNSLRCDNDPTLCNISYGSGILYANVSSFSNYTTDLEPVAAILFSTNPITSGGTETVTCSATDPAGNVANVSLSGDSKTCTSSSSSCSITYQTSNTGQICFTCAATDTNNLQNIKNSCFTVDTIQTGGGGPSGGDAVQAPQVEVPAQETQIEEQTAEQEAQNTEEQQMTVNVDYIPQILLDSVTVQVSEDRSEVSANLDSQGSMKITIEKTAEGISKPRLDLNFNLENKQQMSAKAITDISNVPFTLNFGFFTIAIII